jgi:hypothetical protein
MVILRLRIKAELENVKSVSLTQNEFTLALKVNKA